jgi:hypothetical protein
MQDMLLGIFIIPLLIVGLLLAMRLTDKLFFYFIVKDKK